MSRKNVITRLCMKELFWAMIATSAALNFYTFPSAPSSAKIVFCVFASLIFIFSLAIMVAEAMVSIDDLRRLKKEVTKHRPPSTDVDGSVDAFRNSERDK